jgi:transcriptional/translational regulatory protein YebC/TACO1
LGESGCVAWMFQAKGQLIVEKAAWNDEDKLMTVALDAGAEDIKSDDPEIFQVFTAPADYEKVKTAIEAATIPLSSSEITLLPSTTVTLKEGAARQMEGLMEELENHDDVKDVYTNGDIEAGGGA